MIGALALIKKILVDKNSGIIVQFLRYALVGSVASVVDISLFHLAANLVGVNHIAANTLSFVFGLQVNYFLSRQWVFNKARHSFGRDFALFALIGIIGLLLSNLILYVLVDMNILHRILGFMDNESVKLAAKLAAVIIVLLWNFTARRRIVFGSARGDDETG